MLASVVAFGGTSTPRKKHVKVVYPKVLGVKNAKASLNIQLTIDPGFHIQSNPASQPQLIPTTLDFEKSETIRVGSIAYPVPVKHSQGGALLDTYSGTVDLKAPVTLLSKTSKSSMLKGQLRYQACDDSTCFFPITEPIEIRIESSEKPPKP